MDGRPALPALDMIYALGGDAERALDEDRAIGRDELVAIDWQLGVVAGELRRLLAAGVVDVGPGVPRLLWGLHERVVVALAQAA